MDLSKLDEPFADDEIEWRIQQAGEGNKGIWARCLAYVTNRAIMNRLDSVVGKENWQNTYLPGPNGGVVCRLSIRVNGEWVTKEDGAENTDIESVKGGLSDAMKRAAYQWGIGRYLYYLPEGWAQVSENGEHFATCKIKSNGQEKTIPFRWSPPRLPDWALPKSGPQNTAPERTPEYMRFRAWVVDHYGEEQVKPIINALFDAKVFASDEELFSCTDSTKFRRACEIAKELMQPQTV
jgi:hypothetical protein